MIGADLPGASRMLVCLDLLEPARRDEDPAAYQRCIDGSRRLLAHARDAAWDVVHCLGREWPARAAGGLEPLAREPVYLRDGLSGQGLEAGGSSPWPASPSICATACRPFPAAGFDVV